MHIQTPPKSEALYWHIFLFQGLFSMAVTRYIDQPEKKDLLLQLLEWMTGQGYVVDPSTRNLILKNADLLGRQQTAEILSKQHVMSRLKSIKST